ncbi:MAG: sulfatase [Anaerolineae bacterium]
MPRFTRRDFLKLGSALSGAAALTRLAPSTAALAPAAAGMPNILVFVFDAMTAKNLSVYGYKRSTTPNFERFAKRAIVYNQHYSAANFTTPGTASLLTGSYPWTHRAFNYSGLVARSLAGHNLFEAIGKRYYRLAYSQNMWANYLLGQFHKDIEVIFSPGAFSVLHHIIGDKLPGDIDITHRLFDEFMFQGGQAPVAPVFGLAERLLLRRAYARAPAQDYPRGLPRTGYYPIFFTLKDVFDGLMATVQKLAAPSIAYLHTWSPHAPYRPSKQFDRAFLDGWRPKVKPDHRLSDHSLPKHMNERRQNYDEYVANVDFEFGRMLDFLEARGILETSYVVLTADHGEMFERGVEGHSTPLLYDPVVRVPLLISVPGRQSRQDVNTPTSSTDVLPTLVQLSGGSVPLWSEGQLLPLLGGREDAQRAIYIMDCKTDPAYLPLKRATFVMRKGAHKLIAYRGYAQYDNQDAFELYDIDNDPEELNDLYSESLPLAKDLREELLAKVDQENARYKEPG